MKVNRFGVLAAMIFLSSQTLVGLCSAQETVIGWHSNLDEGRKQAAATGKPLFITFRCVR